MLLSHLKLFITVFLMLGMFCGMGIVSAATDPNLSLAPENCGEDYIYNDNKFNFELNPIKDSNGEVTSYTATVTRKDNNFIEYPVQFVYQIYIVNAFHKVILEPRYIFLGPGKDKVTEIEVLNPKKTLIGLQTENYGIKSPKTNSTGKNMDLSIRDNLFNLELKYNYKWFHKSGFNFNFTKRDNISLNCPVTLKRAITLHFKDIPSYTEWFTFKMNSGSTNETGFKNLDHELISYRTTVDTYYLQFQ